MIPFAEYCVKVQSHLEESYGIRVVTRDVPDPLTGDLDGLEIHIDHAVTPEQRLFLLAHLFGHTVQWNVDPEAAEVGQLHQPPVGESLLRSILDYEREAAGIALGMLHEVGVTDIDEWYSDYAACDAAYLEHYYRTGEVRSFQSFWTRGNSRVSPKPVPRFVPVRRRFRQDGIVI